MEGSRDLKNANGNLPPSNGSEYYITDHMFRLAVTPGFDEVIARDRDVPRLRGPLSYYILLYRDGGYSYTVLWLHVYDTPQVDLLVDQTFCKNLLRSDVQITQSDNMPSVLISSTSSFRALAENGKIVDKSSAILDFLKHDYPVHLLLRPRRSGKTTLLRMFQ
jgi:hypothetical protein